MEGDLLRERERERERKKKSFKFCGNTLRLRQSLFCDKPATKILLCAHFTVTYRCTLSESVRDLNILAALSAVYWQEA